MNNRLHKIMTKQIFLKIMTMLFMFSVCYAENSGKQKLDLDSIRVNLSVKDKQLRDVLSQLSSKKKLHIVFNDALVKDIKVSCSFKNISLRKALEELLKNTKLTFKIMNDEQIIIT